MPLHPPPARSFRRLALATLLGGSLASLGGCAVIAVADTAASIAVSGVGLAADAAIGTVRIGGKVIGAAADLVIPDAAPAP